MNKNQEIDTLICTVVNEDSEVSYYVIKNVEFIDTFQLHEPLWLAYGGEDGFYGKNEIPSALNSLLEKRSLSEEFPYEAFKEAKNPKVITVYF